MTDAPSDDVDVRDSRFERPDRLDSSVFVTDFSTDSGPADSYVVYTIAIGISISGNSPIDTFDIA